MPPTNGWHHLDGPERGDLHIIGINYLLWVYAEHMSQIEIPWRSVGWWSIIGKIGSIALGDAGVLHLILTKYFLVCVFSFPKPNW